MENEKNLKKISLLFVEDDEFARVQISRILKKKCREFIVATDGEEGLEAYKRYKPDIVLTDISMPNMNGLEMVKAIYEINKNAVVIITTAHNESEFLIEAIELGIKSYVIKPIDPVLLIDSISKSAENILIKKELEKKDKLLLQQALLNAKADLLHDIAHHWRQPLTQLSLIAETLLLDYESGDLTLEKFRDSVNIITKTTLDLSQTINIFTSSYNSNSKTFELTKAIDTILFVTKSLYEPKKVKILIDDFKNHFVKGDKNLFLQILNHLIINSLEAHEKNSTKEPFISFKIDREANSLIIEDNGGGVDSSILNSLVEPYFSTKNDLNGKGLGLFVANFLMEKEFDGKLNFKNSKDGFMVSLNFPNSILY